MTATANNNVATRNGMTVMKRNMRQNRQPGFLARVEPLKKVEIAIAAESATNIRLSHEEEATREKQIPAKTATATLAES
ncbi:MAG TPA: hypothetical protein VKT52_12760 [Ktedonobacterales bacterium]|nr:hypothetical protein [Ktedonobacterales bacterium]